MKERLNKNNFISRANQIYNGKYDYSKSIYVKAKEKIIITCPIHVDFEQRPLDHILKVCGCPKCKLVGQTKLYNRLKQQFPQLEIIFEAGHDAISWIVNLRINIYIPSINYAIELNGPLHYEEIPYFENRNSLKITLERDALKRKKCKDSKCRLIELKYYYTDEDFLILVNEVTLKLEKLQKKYYDEEASLKEKDEYALEAGKLMVKELLHNTKDNAGLL